MQTTRTDKKKFTALPLALVGFLLLTAAGAGITARQVLTAAPAVSGAVDLANTTGTEGTGTALMRADATLGVKGILSVAHGGTGTSTGTFTGTLQLTDGLIGTPSYSWSNETNTGMYRAGAGDIRYSLGGADVGQWTVRGYRTASGVVATPGYSFTAETNSGLYRNGANDLRFSVAGADKTFWNAAGFGVGAAPTYPLDVQATPVGSTTARFKPSGMATFAVVQSATLADLGFNLHFDSGQWNYGVTGFGAVSEFDSSAGNWKFETAPSGTAGTGASITERFRISPSGVQIGSSGTAIAIVYKGTCTLNGSTPAQCTQTVPAAAIHCICSVDNVTSVAACATSVTSTTLTVTATNGLAAQAFAICTD